MKSLLNWRQWVLYALFAGCFLAFLMMCDETDNTMREFISIRIKALALMLVCGYPLGKLTKKWEREGKITKFKDKSTDDGDESMQGLRARSA